MAGLAGALRMRDVLHAQRNKCPPRLRRQLKHIG